jgi:hypothetical protein
MSPIDRGDYVLGFRRHRLGNWIVSEYPVLQFVKLLTRLDPEPVYEQLPCFAYTRQRHALSAGPSTEPA